MNMMPPSLEEWTEQGPNARPLPTNNIFSPNYQGLNDDLDYDGEFLSDDDDNDDDN